MISAGNGRCFEATPLLFCCIVGLDGFCLNDDGGVCFLPILAFGCDSPCHVAARQEDAAQNDGHDYNSFHNVKDRFCFSVNFEIRCKGSIKKRDRQESSLATVITMTFSVLGMILSSGHTPHIPKNQALP